MDSATLYDEDFVIWTQRQAAALRRLASERVNLGRDLDLDHLAEEIEDLGKRDRRGLKSRLARLFEHLIKLEHSAQPEPRAQWQTSVKKQRDAILDLLADSPSLKAELDQAFREAWDRGADYAHAAVARDMENTPLPAEPPYTPAQVLDRDWWPRNRHGLA